MVLSVSYSEGTKVGYPQNEFDKADFHISLKHEEEFADPPEDEAEYTAWWEARNSRYTLIFNDLKEKVATALQEVVDEFIEKNSPDSEEE